MNDQPMTQNERAAAMLAAVHSLQEQSERQAGEETDSFQTRPAVTRSAEERGQEMMAVPWGKLPPVAVEFAKHLCSNVGFCAEVLLTAWTVYAQCSEGLPCRDPLYSARPEDIEWFRERLANELKPESEWVPGRPNGGQWNQLPGLTVNRPSRQTPRP